MNSWEIGKELSQIMNLNSSSLAERILLVYVDYKEINEAREFVVRLPDLLAREEITPAMKKILQPLIDYYDQYLLKDCNEFNKKLAELIANRALITTLQRK